MLVAFGGLPATGKSTLAQTTAARLGAAYVRVDEIEAAMWRAGIARDQPTGLAAYVVAASVAEGSLRQGTPVVVDAVNPVEAARQGWRELSDRTGAPLRVVEVVCSDPAEHRRRAEGRENDVDGLVYPTWAQITAREYEPWDEERLTVDTLAPTEECLDAIDAYLRG